MNVTFEIDASRLTMQMNRMVDLLKVDARDVVKDQTRLLLKQVIAFTPPKTLAQGRKAVARDVRRAMTPITTDMFPNERMRDRVQLLTSRGDQQGLQAIFRNSKSWPMWRVEDFSPVLHTFARDRRGRVRRGRYVFVSEPTERPRQWGRYVREMMSFVGRLKAAWGPAYEAVGGSLPGWVKRHASPRGKVTVNFGDAKRPSVEFKNSAVGVGQLVHPFRSAMAIRARVLAKDIQRRLRIAAQKAGFDTK